LTHAVCAAHAVGAPHTAHLRGIDTRCMLLMQWVQHIAQAHSTRTTDGAHTAGAHTAGAHTDGAHTDGAHTAGAHTAGAHTAGAHTAGAHTAGAHTDGAHTDGAHTDGAPHAHAPVCIEAPVGFVRLWQRRQANEIMRASSADEHGPGLWCGWYEAKCML